MRFWLCLFSFTASLSCRDVRLACAGMQACLGGEYFPDSIFRGHVSCSDGATRCPLREICCAQEPAACVSEQVTLQLVPWSCAFDVLEDPATITCMPAYLQLSTAPGVRHSPQAVLPAHCYNLWLHAPLQRLARRSCIFKEEKICTICTISTIL